MDNIYDTLAKLNEVANRPEAKKIVKEDSNGMMRKGLKNLINKSSKMNKQSNYTPFSDKQSPDGLPEKKKDTKMFEKESDVERDDRAEKAGREVAHDAKYDHRRHAGKDGKDVTGDIEYDEKHDKDGMHEASKTMVKGPDGKMVPDYAVDGKGKHDMKEGGSLKDAARAGVMARLAELAGLPAQEIEEALGESPQDTASRIMSEVSLDESDIDQIADVGKVYPKIAKMKMDLVDKGMEPEDAHDEACEKYNVDPAMCDKYIEMKRDDREKVKEEDTNEGNAFSGALEDAKENGKAEFTVDGKKYKVEAIDSDEDAIQEDEGKDGDMPSKAHIEKMCKDGKTKKEICDMHPNCDQGELKKMIDDCGELNEGGGHDMDCATCDGTGKDDDKECKSCEGSGEAQDDDDPMNNESKVEETTSSGSVATSEGGGKALYKNASVYESNEIVKRAKQLNEDMSFTVSGGPDQEPTLNINASGTEAQQLGQLLKLSGLGMKPAAPQYGEVEIQVAEDQEFANGADDENTMDTEYMTQDIAGGLNGPKKMAYPKVAGGDNPMAVLEASELNEVGEDRLMKLYQAYKAK